MQVSDKINYFEFVKNIAILKSYAMGDFPQDYFMFVT